MLRTLLILLTMIVLTPAPVQAELRDLRADRQEGVARIWLGFQEQPRILETDAGPNAISLLVSGVNDRQRAIEPVNRDLVSSVLLVPQGDQIRIDLLAAGRWTFRSADIYQNGLLITVEPGPGIDNAARTSVFAQTAPQHVSAPVGEPTAAPRALPEQMTPLPEREGSAEPDPRPAPQTQSSTPPEPARRVVAAATPVDLVSSPASTVPAASGPCGVSAAAVEASPWDDNALLAHADCLTGQGERDAAAAIYEQMLAFEPENARVAMALAEIRSAEGDRSRARELYIQAAENARTDGEAALARHLARELSGN